MATITFSPQSFLTASASVHTITMGAAMDADSSSSSNSSKSSASSASSDSSSSLTSHSSESSASSDSSSSKSSQSSASSDSSSHSSQSSASSNSSDSSSTSESSSSSSFDLYIAPANVLRPEQYLSIAQGYAQARVQRLSAYSDFYGPVDLVAKLNQIQPTLDLMQPFYETYQQVGTTLGGTVLFDIPVRSLQSHIQTFGGETTVAGYIQKYIIGNGLAAGIPEQWAVLSKAVGVDIDSVIDPETIVPSSSSSE